MNAAATQSKVSKSPMLIFSVPKDKDYLAALGTVSVRHAQLEHILRMTIKTLAGVSLAEMLDATEYQGPGRLRERIGKLAQSKLKEGQALIKLQAIMRRCERASEKRNNLVHGVIAEDFDRDGELLHVRSHGLEELPKVTALYSLAAELVQLTKELNAARLEGFLAEALVNKK